MNELALVAALAAFASLAPAFALKEAVDGSATLAVSCDEKGEVKHEGPVSITKPNTTLTLTCPSGYTAKPAPTSPPTVYTSKECNAPGKKLEESSPKATGELVSGQSNALKLVFPTVPTGLTEFYLKCDPPNGSKTACTVHVRVGSTPPPAKPQDGDGLGGGAGEGQGAGGEAGTTGVQTCVHSTKTITIRIPEKGSTAQFACESGSTLYPIEPDKVFSKDCKKQETLKDMTRTPTPAAASVRGPKGSGGVASPTYTLKADKKPAKKTLCYLCATAGTSAEQPGSAANYCTIYVESGAGARFSLSFIAALALPCVLAELQFT